VDWEPSSIPDLTGKLAVVTGGNTGLGLAAAHVLAQRGARVVIASRNVDKAGVAVAKIRAANPEADVSFERLDLGDLASVRAFGAQLRRHETKLDLLLNNAGLMATDEGRTADGFETQLGVNHLGHFALTAELMPLLQASTAARVVAMSSMAHRSGQVVVGDLMFDRRRYRRWQAYSQSKLANLLFTKDLDRRLRAASSPVQALSAHPGMAHTELGTEGGGLSNAFFRPLMRLGQSAERGAQPMLRAATDPTAVGGEYYGPKWTVRGSAVRDTPSARAQRADDAEALWVRSEELTGTEFSLVSTL
jgi:NAD(P)-dependent dehydrogenase (short-subunit alcohol dehydrogenase family)